MSLQHCFAALRTLCRAGFPRANPLALRLPSRVLPVAPRLCIRAGKFACVSSAAAAVAASSSASPPPSAGLSAGWRRDSLDADRPLPWIFERAAGAGAIILRCQEGMTSVEIPMSAQQQSHFDARTLRLDSARLGQLRAEIAALAAHPSAYCWFGSAGHDHLLWRIQLIDRYLTLREAEQETAGAPLTPNAFPAQLHPTDHSTRRIAPEEYARRTAQLYRYLLCLTIDHDWASEAAQMEKWAASNGSGSAWTDQDM